MIVIFTTREAAAVIISAASFCLFVCLSFTVRRQLLKALTRTKFFFAHQVDLQGIQVKVVHEGHRVKVTVTRANNVKCYPATPALDSAFRHWGAASKHDDEKFYSSYQCRIIQGHWRAIFIGLPYLTECTHSRVICLRLEGSLVYFQVSTYFVSKFRIIVLKQIRNPFLPCHVCTQNDLCSVRKLSTIHVILPSIFCLKI